MSDLLQRLKKNSAIDGANTIDNSDFFEHDVIPFEIPVMNIAFSGDLDGGLIPGFSLFAGPSKHGKSIMASICARAYTRKYEDSIILFYDSEFGTPKSYFKSLNVGTDRIFHCPLLNIGQFRHDVVKQLDMIKKEFPGAKVFILVDSFGNLASNKESDDALKGDNKTDMTRQKDLKSLTRIITPYLNIMKICMVGISHTYDTLETYSKQVVSGGCVAQGTEIIMSDGTKKQVQDIVVGDEVLTLGIDNKIISSQVTHTWNPDTLTNGYPKCYKITFDDNYSVVCSEDHMFLRLIDKKQHWIKARDLVIHDYVEQYINNDLYLCTITDIEDMGNVYVYDLTIKDTKNYFLGNGIISHNTGIYYSANNVYIMGRRQEKEGTDIKGFNLIMNVDKSRFCVEKAKFAIELRFGKGLNKYTGLLDVALNVGGVVKPSNGWYSRVVDGEQEDKKWRKKDTNCAEFWDVLLENEDFKERVRRAYNVSYNKLISDDDDDDDLIVDVTKDEIEFTNQEDDDID